MIFNPAYPVAARPRYVDHILKRTKPFNNKIENKIFNPAYPRQLLLRCTTSCIHAVVSYATPLRQPKTGYVMKRAIKRASI